MADHWKFISKTQLALNAATMLLMVIAPMLAYAYGGWLSRSALAFLWAGTIFQLTLQVRGSRYRFRKAEDPTAHGIDVLSMLLFCNATLLFLQFLTIPLRRLPDFYLLGQQKAGTSALGQYLQQHPDLVGPENHIVVNVFRRKETQFWVGNFGGPSPLFASSTLFRIYFPTVVWDWYRRHVRRLPAAKAYDATPDHLFFPWVAPRIATATPNAKHLIVLRNPTTRAFSQWNMNRSASAFMDRPDYLWNGDSFEAALQWERDHLQEMMQRAFAVDPRAMPNADRSTTTTAAAAVDVRQNNLMPDLVDFCEGSFVERGMYAKQLRHYFRFVPREQFLVIFSEDLQENPHAVMEKVWNFLGVRSVPVVNTVFNEGSYAKKDKSSSSSSASCAQSTAKAADADEDSIRMTPEQKTLLNDIFRGPNRDLMELLGIDRLPAGWAV